MDDDDDEFDEFDDALGGGRGVVVKRAPSSLFGPDTSTVSDAIEAAAEAAKQRRRAKRERSSRGKGGGATRARAGTLEAATDTSVFLHDDEDEFEEFDAVVDDPGTAGGAGRAQKGQKAAAGAGGAKPRSKYTKSKKQQEKEQRRRQQQQRQQQQQQQRRRQVQDISKGRAKRRPPKRGRTGKTAGKTLPPHISGLLGSAHRHFLQGAYGEAIPLLSEVRE